MNARILSSRILAVGGLLAMLAGAIDPLEGSFVILIGSGMVALSALIGASRYRLLLYWAFVLIAAGVGAMVVFTLWGGIGGRSGHSLWWSVLVLPYPVGWIMGLVGVVCRLIECFKRLPQC